MRAGTRGADPDVVGEGEGYWKQRKTRATRHAHLTSPFHRIPRSFEGRRSGLGLAPPRSAPAARIQCQTSRSLLVASPTRVKRACQHQAGTSREWDFDGHIELGVVGRHVPAVLGNEKPPSACRIATIHEERVTDHKARTRTAEP